MSLKNQPGDDADKPRGGEWVRGKHDPEYGGLLISHCSPSRPSDTGMLPDGLGTDDSERSSRYRVQGREHRCENKRSSAEWADNVVIHNTVNVRTNGVTNAN